MKKILIISTNSDEAGAPRHVERLASLLMSTYEVYCVFGERGPVAMRLSRLGVNVQYIPRMRNAFNPLDDIIAMSGLIAKIIKIKPEIIHCHSAKAGMLGRLAAWFLSTPSVYTVHGWGWRGMPPAKARIIRAIEKLLSFLPKSRYIYVAHSVQREAIEELSIAPAKGVVVHNGSPSPPYRESTGNENRLSEITIIMPARVCEAKDHATLLLAFDTLPENYKLLLCGSGTNSDEFIAFARKTATRRHRDISFLGETSDIFGLYRRSDIFVLSSKFEALPLSIIEAMSFKLPVVASNVGGVNELVVDQCTGYLFHRGDHIALADCLRKLSSTQARDALGEYGSRIYLERFTENSMVSKIMAVYESLDSTSDRFCKPAGPTRH
jgi:glycosyltransferase involved in cell wall biosynthesis